MDRDLNFCTLHALAPVAKDKTEAAYFRTVLFDKRRDLMALGAVHH